MLSLLIFEVIAIENAWNPLMSRGKETTAAMYSQTQVQHRVQSGVNLQASAGKQRGRISAETHLFYWFIYSL